MTLLLNRTCLDGKELPVEYMPWNYMDKKTLKNRYAHLLSLAGESFDISDMAYEDLSSLLHDLEQLELCVRQKMSDIYERERFGELKPFPDGKSRPSESLQVNVCMEDDVLRIFCPNTFFRNRSECWHLSVLIEAALLRYEKEGGVQLNQMLKTPLHLVVKRRAGEWNAHFRDNDNLEMTKIVNTICSLLGTTDAAKNISYTSCFSFTEDPSEYGTEISVFEDEHESK